MESQRTIAALASLAPGMGSLTVIPRKDEKWFNPKAQGYLLRPTVIPISRSTSCLSALVVVPAATIAGSVYLRTRSLPRLGSRGGTKYLQAESHTSRGATLLVRGPLVRGLFVFTGVVCCPFQSIKVCCVSIKIFL